MALRLQHPLMYLLFLIGAVSCTTNPVTGKKELSLISESQEIHIGEEVYGYMQQAQGGDYRVDPQVQIYVEKIGKRLAAVSDRPNLPYEFVVLDSSIANAWALPGGKIAIYRGLLNELNNEAELAAVLAHEIVHSAARHSAQAMQRGTLMQAGLATVGQLLGNHGYEEALMQGLATGAGLVHMRYSRQAELEADRYGIKYMVAAGYDPQAAIDLQKTFLRLSEGRQATWLHDLFATHPPSIERIRANEVTAAEYPQGGRWGIKEYQTAMATLKKDAPGYKELDSGYQALMRGNTREALEHAEKGIALVPNEGHLYNLKGKCLVSMNRYTEALACFDKAIEFNDSYFDFYLQRGLLEAKMGKWSASKRDLDKSNVLLPSAEAHYALGELELREGNRLEAMRHFQIAGQAHNQAGNNARAADKRLEAPLEAVIGQAHLDEDHTLHITLTNECSQPVDAIEMEVSFYDTAVRLLSVQKLQYSRRIDPYHKVRITYPSKAPLEAFFAQVQVIHFRKGI